MKQRPTRKKHDLTFPLVLLILLLFPLLVDQAFVKLKETLRAHGGLYGTIEYPEQHVAASVVQPCGAACQGVYGTAPSPLFLPQTSANAGAGGIAGLAALERAQWEQLRARRLGRLAPTERWEAIEPRPSNPSRFFPELRHPTLASGVALTTGAADPHWSDPPPRTVAQAVAKAEGPTWPFQETRTSGTPLPQWPFNEPRSSPSRAPASLVQEQPVSAALPEPEAPRLSFTAHPLVEKPRDEKLVEVCGRLVRVNDAAAELAECAGRQEEAAKPKEVDEGGTQTLLMP